MKWIKVTDKLPGDDSELCLICHYNRHIEVARFNNGDWYVISPRFSQDDEMIGPEGQPDYWMEIIYPNEMC
jgi:hypothetical protein